MPNLYNGGGNDENICGNSSYYSGGGGGGDSSGSGNIKSFLFVVKTLVQHMSCMEASFLVYDAITGGS